MISIKIDGKIRTVKGVYYKAGNELKRLLVQMKDGSQVRNFIRYTIQKVFKYDFPESTSQTRSTKINLLDLISIDGITVDTGEVSYIGNGEELTITVKNGKSSRSEYDDKKYSKTVTDYSTSSSNSFSSSRSYNSGGYTGTLYKNGSSYVSSGSYYPGDSKEVTHTAEIVESNYWKWNGTKWEWVRRTYSGSQSSYYYNSGGYSGTLSQVARKESPPYYNDYPSNPTVGQEFLYHGCYITVTFAGTVTKPAVDTRVYRQDYKGTVYMGGTTYYYKYNVNIKYTAKN